LERRNNGRIPQGQTLCDRDAIRTGANSRAAIQLVDDAVLRLDQNTTLVLSDIAPEPEERSLLQLVFGAIQSFSRRPQTLQIDTPYINATIEGTEFALRVTGQESALTVVEGIVVASNALGSVNVASGGGAVASEGSAPRSVIIARPRDAVAWGLYYPPALSLTGATGTPALDEAMRLAAGDRPDLAIAMLEAAPDPSTQMRIYQASLLLSVGRVDEAGRILDAVVAAEPGNGADPEREPLHPRHPHQIAERAARQPPGGQAAERPGPRDPLHLHPERVHVLPVHRRRHVRDGLGERPGPG